VIRGGRLVGFFLLLGAFTFAFVSEEAIHETGHLLAHRAYGVDARIVLDPFGGSHTVIQGPVDVTNLGITSLAGPLFALFVSVLLFLVVWQFRRPVLLPLLLMLPLSMIQEGVTFSLGLLTPCGDSAWIVDWGMPAPLLVTIGALLLLAGVLLLAGLLPIAGLSRNERFARRLAFVASSMLPFMVVRLAVSAARSTTGLIENAVPLVFGAILSVAVAFLVRRVRLPGISPSRVTWTAALTSLCLALAAIGLQAGILN